MRFAAQSTSCEAIQCSNKMTTKTLQFIFAALAFAMSIKAASAQDITPDEARAIAKEAYVYGFPMVDSYRIQYAYFVDTKSSEYKASWNNIVNVSRVFTSEDKAVQTPNSDTPYSFLGMDLRAEPIVLTVPAIEKDRYYSLQLIDAYTFNFDYIGSRSTGNDAGSFLVAGPAWKGALPKGIKKVIRSETELVLALYRTQLFAPGDIGNVKQVQAGYKVQTLSSFLGQSAPRAAPRIDFIKPLAPDMARSYLVFFNVLNFVLQFCPTVASEKELMSRFSRIGVGSRETFDASKLAPEIKTAIEQGMSDGWADFAALKKRMDVGEVTSGECFGARDALNNNYLYRMAAAVIGIYGNSKLEAMYPLYSVDADGQNLNGNNRYTLRIAPGQLPPVDAFWSLTMYELPSSLLTVNPMNRYLLNSPMIPQFKKDKDGGLTLYIQSESPGVEKEPNWLPAPKGPFFVVMRLYWPTSEALEGKWTPPPMKKSE